MSKKPNLYSCVTSSEQASYCALSDLPKSTNLITSSMRMQVDGRSNFTLVACPSSLHNVIQNNNEVGNTR